MPDINTVIPKIVAALDEAYLVAGLPNQTAQIAALTSANTTLTNEKAALQAKIDAAIAAANADKAADSASVAGQGVLDALS